MGTHKIYLLPVTSWKHKLEPSYQITNFNNTLKILSAKKFHSFSRYYSIYLAFWCPSTVLSVLFLEKPL